MVNMEFQSREKDIENTPSKIRYKNVLYINNESALMRQNSSMRFWYFSNTKWGDKVFIHTRILPEIKTPPTAILHNGGCETYAEPTLLIGMDNAQDQNKAVYIFGITMEEANEMVFINLTTKVRDWFSRLKQFLLQRTTDFIAVVKRGKKKEEHSEVSTRSQFRLKIRIKGRDAYGPPLKREKR